jgi:hypothetical protein
VLLYTGTNKKQVFMKTIRRNNIKELRELSSNAKVLGVYKCDGYYPIALKDVLSVINQKLVSSAILDDSGRLTLDITDRSLGQYIVALPSLEYAKTQLFPKDYARLHPENELSQRKRPNVTP